MNGQRSSKNWVLISAYVDDQLTAREKKKFEQLLRAQPELQGEIEQLRQTRALIHSLPRKRAPRNFTLTPEMVTVKKPARLLPLFSLTSAASAVVALVLLFIQFFPGFLSARQAVSMAGAPQMETALQANDATSSENAPKIIYWGGPPSPVTVEGKGGGAAEETYFGGAAPLLEVQPGTIVPPAEKSGVPTATPEAPPVAQAVAPTAAAEAAQPAATASAALEGESTTAQQYDQSQNPILGIRPSDEAGQMTIPTTQPQARVQSRPLWPVGIALLGVALATGLTAFLLWRRSR